ncbi:PIN domain-containing protein [Bacillus luti]
MKTIFVLDTNVVLHDHNAFLHFGENEVVIPLTVIEELDSKKGRVDAVGKSARTFFNFYKSNSQLMKKGVIPLENGGNLRIEPNYNSLEILKNFLFEDDNDNRILSVALNLCKEQLEKQKEDSSTEVNRVILVTNDGAMFAKALTLKEEFDFGEFFDVELYENDRIKDIDHKHKGFHEVVVPSDVISEIYDSESNMRLASILHHIEDQLFLNDNGSEEVRINTSEQKILEELVKHNIYILDFFILKSAENSKSSCIVQLKLEAGVLVLKGLLFSKKPNSFGISARNAQQHMLLELLLNDSIPIVFV